MTFRLRILPRAEHDAQHIFDWLRARSPDGAIRWWFAFDQAVQKLTEHPQGYGLAPESDLASVELRQFLFKTRRGRRYRGVFVVHGDESSSFGSEAQASLIYSQTKWSKWGSFRGLTPTATFRCRFAAEC